MKRIKLSREKNSSTTAQIINGFTPLNAKEQKALDKIFALLLEKSQVDFSQYRDSTILRRLNRRMNLAFKENYSAYYSFLKQNSDESEQLYFDLLLSYTQFFRDAHIFEALKKEVFPRLVNRDSARTPIRIWVPGCSTGKEVYSIAISLFEFLEEKSIQIPVKIIGTDLVQQHISTARSGIYNEKIREEVSSERLKRFFEITPEGLKVVRHIREMCVFAAQDITLDPPLPHMDLISCRNVLIYFDTAYLDEVIPRFHFSLNPQGFLLLGTSETMNRFPELFNSIDAKSNLYSKRLSEGKPLYDFPYTQKALKAKASVTSAPESSVFGSNHSKESDQINRILLDSYAPPGVQVNKDLIVRRFLGNTHDFFSPASGEASLKLSRITDKVLMPDIYSAVQSAKKSKKKVRKKNVLYKKEGLKTYLDICVIPVDEKNIKETDFLILFETVKAPPIENPELSKKSKKARTEIEHLQYELEQTREHLQSIIEEKDRVNQELWAANEEIMSSNEELQSVNEEMEASKEELESGNEELMALNEEIRMKSLTITESEEKQRQLLQNIHAGVVVHAPDTSILMANKRACEILGLTVDQMMGTSAMDPLWSFFRDDGSSMPPEEYPVNKVIATQKPVRFLEIGINRPQTHDVVWVFVHAYPEMSKSGTLSQVIVTFVDITENRDAERALRENEKLLRKMADNYPNSYISIINKDYTIGFTGGGEFKKLNLDPQQFIGINLEQVFGDKTDFIKGYYDKTFKGEEQSFELFQDNQHQLYRSVPLPSEDGSIDRIFVVVENITERKEAQFALQASEEKFSKAFDLNPNTMAIIDIETLERLAVNDYFAEIVGHSKEELLKHPLGALGEIDLDKVHMAANAVKQGRSLRDIEVILTDSKGCERVMLYAVEGIKIGKRSCMMVVGKDISERKEAENKLRESLERFKGFDQHSTEGVYRVDLIKPVPISLPRPEFVDRVNINAVIGEVNDSLARMYGLKPGDMIGRTAIEFAPDYGERAALVLERKGYQVANEETMDMDKDGKAVYLIENYHGIVENDCLISIWGAQNDISERKKAEMDLQESEERFRILYDYSPDMYVSVSPEDASILRCNQTLLEKTGYSKEEIVGSPIFAMYHDDSLKGANEAFEQFVKTGRVSDKELILKRKDGSKLPVSLNVKAVRDKNGKILYSLSSWRDITEKKRVEEEREKLQRELTHSHKMEAIGQLAGGIAHDFNNLLTGILNSAVLLNQPQRNLDEKGKKYTNLIINTSETAAELVQKLLALSGKGILKRAPVNMGKLLDDVVSILMRTIDKSISIEVNNQCDCNIIGDAALIQNAMINLGVNASHAMPDGGTLNFVMTQVPAGETQIANNCSHACEVLVIDTGWGIAEEVMDKIFDPFFTTKDPGKGTGLGLSTVYSTIRDHGGLIDVSSTEGEGTTFKIVLPCSDEEISHKEEISKDIAGKGTVLLVDDEEIIRITVTDFLEFCGFKVLTAENGSEALEQYRVHKENIDIVLLDMIMPGMNGFNTYYQLKDMDENCKVILTTGFADDKRVDEMLKDGLSGLIKKPYDNYEMAHYINQLILESQKN